MTSKHGEVKHNRNTCNQHYRTARRILWYKQLQYETHSLLHLDFICLCPLVQPVDSAECVPAIYNCSWYQLICTQHSISYILIIPMQFHPVMSSTYCSLLRMRLGGNVSDKCHRNEWCEDHNGCRRAHSSDICFGPYSFSNECVFVSFC